jgi:hypothetical protein
MSYPTKLVSAISPAGGPNSLKKHLLPETYGVSDFPAAEGFNRNSSPPLAGEE